MNSSYNQNFKTIEQNLKFPHRSQESNIQKPKPRQSQPPMMTQDFDFSVDNGKSYKDQLFIQSNQPGRNYRNYEYKLQSSPKMNSNNFNNFSAQISQKKYENKVDISSNADSKIYQQTSPKNQSFNFPNQKSNNSYKNIPISPSSNTQIQNFQISQRKIPSKSDGLQYKTSINLESTTSPKKDANLPKSETLNNFTYPKKSTNGQQSVRVPIQNANKKAPRYSEPGIFSLNSQQQTKNNLDDRSSLYKQNKQDGSIRSYNMSSQAQKSKFTQKYSFNGSNYDSKTIETDSTNKNQFFKKEKQVKQIGSASHISALVKPKFNKLPFRVSDFQKGKQLGSGKFGAVSIVRHKKTGFICALKSIPKQIIKEENIVGQFIRQIKIQTYLDHPNITKLYGFFDDADYIYLLLELSSEGQLYQLLKQKKKLTQKTVIYLIKQLCQAIKYLHNQNIIHRDIKPQNIVLQYGTIKLCDFGWAVCRGGQLRSTFCGTPLYVSPQILKGQMYDQKIDIWSIGILTYQLLIGQIPFQITTEQQLIKIIKQDIVFPPNVNISQQSKDFILKILKKNPDQRLKIGKLLDHPFLQHQVQITDIEL